MGRADIRDISPMLKLVRNFLLGRKHTLGLRFEHEVASRNPPAPIIPDGPTHKLAANYYCNRDARREVAPPKKIVAGPAQIADGACGKPKSRAPGPVHQWDGTGW